MHSDITKIHKIMFLRNFLLTIALYLQVLGSFGLYYDGASDVKVFDNTKEFREGVLLSDQIWLGMLSEGL